MGTCTVNPTHKQNEKCVIAVIFPEETYTIVGISLQCSQCYVTGEAVRLSCPTWEKLSAWWVLCYVCNRTSAFLCFINHEREGKGW